MVDVSGGGRRRGGRSDTIWIAHGPTIADAPLADSPFSRTEAVRLIHSLLLREIESKRRVLVCFDFAYGYPVDFAAALQAATGKSVSFTIRPWWAATAGSKTVCRCRFRAAGVPSSSDAISRE